MAKTPKGRKPAGGWPRASQGSAADRKRHLFDRVLNDLQLGRLPEEKKGHILWLLSQLLGTWPELAVARPPEQVCTSVLGPLSVEDLRAVMGYAGSSEARTARVRGRVFPQLFGAEFLSDFLSGLDRAFVRAESPEEVEAVAWAFHFAAGALQGTVPAGANQLLSLVTFALVRENNELTALGRQIEALDIEVAAGTLSQEERQQRLREFAASNPVLRFAYQRQAIEQSRTLVGGVLSGEFQTRLSPESLQPLLEGLTAAAQAAGAKDDPDAFARFLLGDAQWGAYTRFAADAANASVFDRFGADLAAEAQAARAAASPHADALEATVKFWENTVRGSASLKAQLVQACLLALVRPSQRTDAPPSAPSEGPSVDIGGTAR
jgi:hypothetical protein